MVQRQPWFWKALGVPQAVEQFSVTCCYYSLVCLMCLFVFPLDKLLFRDVLFLSCLLSKSKSCKFGKHCKLPDLQYIVIRHVTYLSVASFWADLTWKLESNFKHRGLVVAVCLIASC